MKPQKLSYRITAGVHDENPSLLAGLTSIILNLMDIYRKCIIFDKDYEKNIIESFLKHIFYIL